MRLSRGIDSLGAAAGALRRAGLVLAVACLVFAASAAGPAWLAVAVLLAGAALHVTGEMLQVAWAWMVGYDLAPPERMGQYQGLFNTGVGAAQQLAPACCSSCSSSSGSSRVARARRPVRGRRGGHLGARDPGGRGNIS